MWILLPFKLSIWSYPKCLSKGSCGYPKGSLSQPDTTYEAPDNGNGERSNSTPMQRNTVRLFQTTLDIQVLDSSQNYNPVSTYP